MLRMPQSINDEDRRVRIQTTMTLLSLNQCADTVIRRLSGGERKRLAFATVLLTDPHIVLIDEPMSGLDSYLAKALMKLMRQMANDQHRTIIVVLHQPTSDMLAFLDSRSLIVHGARQAFFW
jgi:ABC-type multidrug transport system ATPase subunit